MKLWLKAESNSAIAEFYNRKYKRSGKEAFTGYDFYFFFKAYQDLFGKPRPTDKLMDCGCGHGEFLERVISQYKFSIPNLSGMDLSIEAIDLAKLRFRNYEYEINVLEAPMESIGIRFKNEFDIITCWGSIEHTNDPLKTLGSMLEAVKPGGFIMLTVPIEFEGCLDGIKSEQFQNNNERFMDYMEWLAYFSKVKKPIMTERIKMPDYDDLFLVFKK